MNSTMTTISKIDATRSRTFAAHLDEDSITETTEANSRLQTRRLNDGNVLLRDELVRIEESAFLHECHAFKAQQKFDRIKKNFKRLEKESDEHKQLINNFETQEKRCREALRKIEKNHQTDIKNFQIDKKTLSSALEESNQVKFEYLNQLLQTRTKLTEETFKYRSLQSKVEELSQINTNMEDYYRKKIQTLQDSVDYLKNENPSFLPVISIQHIESSIVPMLEENDGIIEYIQNLCKSKVQRSLYTELKSLGISPEKKKLELVIEDWENKRESYSNEIEKAMQQIDRFSDGFGRFISWHLTILYVAIAFILWFYIKYDNSFHFNLLFAGLSLKWWSFEEVIDHHIGIHEIPTRPL